MNEVEAKILEIDVAAVTAELESMQAQKVFDGELINHMYRKEGYPGFFRIREQGEKIITTLKTKTGNNTDTTKSLDEREKEVDSKEQGEKDAHILGFSYDTTTRKHRVEYAIGEVHFAIDSIPGIPSFLEIEAENEEYVLAWAEKLGFTQEQLKPWGYTKLMKHYAKQA